MYACMHVRMCIYIYIYTLCSDKIDSDKVDLEESRLGAGHPQLKQEAFLAHSISDKVDSDKIDRG